MCVCVHCARAHLLILPVQRRLLRLDQLLLLLAERPLALRILHTIGAELHLVRLGVLALLGQRLLDPPQVEQFGRRFDVDARAGALLAQLREVELVPLAHRLEQLSRALLVLVHRAVPHLVKLLELKHVRLLDAEPLRDLPRAQVLVAPLLLVPTQLLQPLLRDVRLHVFARRLARFLVVLEELNKVLQRRLVLIGLVWLVFVSDGYERGGRHCGDVRIKWRVWRV